MLPKKDPRVLPSKEYSWARIACESTFIPPKFVSNDSNDWASSIAIHWQEMERLFIFPLISAQLPTNASSANVDTGTNKPVMVFFHGGGFVKKSGQSYLNGPEYILDQDIVLVTMNYRLGALGTSRLDKTFKFLLFQKIVCSKSESVNCSIVKLENRLNRKQLKFYSENQPQVETIKKKCFFFFLRITGFLATGDSVLPGNLGLKDQVVGLRWVKNNIESFGGDPNCVTITGYSAGSWGVGLHMVSPMSKGHKAIAMSGSPVRNSATSHDLTKYTKMQARMFGCPDDTSRRIVECLKTKSAIEIAKTYPKFAASIEQPDAARLRRNNKVGYSILSLKNNQVVDWFNSRNGTLIPTESGFQ